MFCYIRSGVLYTPTGTRATDLGSFASMTHMVGNNHGNGPCVIVPEADKKIITLKNVVIEVYNVDSSTTLLILPVQNHDTGTHVFVAFVGSGGALPHPRWVVITNAWQVFGGGWHVRMFTSRDKAVNEVTNPSAQVHILQNKLNL